VYNKRFHLLSIILFITLLIVCYSSKPAYATDEEGVTVDVEGISPLVNGDKIQAEQMAIVDASRKAVEQVVGTLVASQTDVKDFQLIQDTIKTRASGYVSHQEVLNRWEDKGIYHVILRATVKRNALRQSVDELKLTLIKAGKPRLMILISDPDIASKITENMKDAGFPVVDPGRARQLQKSAMGAKVFDEDQQNLSKLAMSLQAEILIVGDIRREFVGEIQGVHADRAYLTLKAIQADTGQTLVSQTFNARGAGLTDDVAFQKALDNASDQAVDFFKEQLGKHLVDSERSLQITADGITYSDLQQLQHRLKATPNVDNVFLRNFNNGNAQLDIDTGLLPDQLADLISGWKELNMEIINISGSKIILRHKG